MDTPGQSNLKILQEFHSQEIRLRQEAALLAAFCRRIKYIGPFRDPDAESALHLVRVTTLLLFLATSFAAEPRRVAVYAPQTNYQVDILVRDGVDYVGLTDLLEPLGRLEVAHRGQETSSWYSMADAAEFQDGKRQYRTRSSNKLELPSNFLLVDGRGYVPSASMTQLLPQHCQSNCGVPRDAARACL